MPKDSQGNFSTLYNWEEDAANGIDIVPDRHQENDDDLAQGLTTSLDRQGRGGMQAALAMGNNPINQVSAGSALSDVAPISQLQTNTYSIGSTDTGSANTYVTSLTPAPTAYTTGLRVTFYATNANTGASTLQVGGLTPAPALQFQQKDLESGFIQDGSLVDCEFDGVAFQILNVPGILNQAAGGTGASSLGTAAFRDIGTAATNVAEIVDVSGNAGLPSSLTVGTNTNDSAAAGYVGEYVSEAVELGTPVALTNQVPVNIASISLGAGDWDVSVTASITANAATNVTTLFGSISETSATLDNSAGTLVGTYYGTQQITSPQGLTVGPARKSFASTTTVYLVMECAFTVNTCSGYGIISARRVR